MNPEIEDYKAELSTWDINPLSKEITEACTPYVNFNGNDADDLINEWEAFGEALERAIKLLPHASFHGRNQANQQILQKGIRTRIQIAKNLAGLKAIADEVYSKLSINKVNYT